MAVAWEPAVGTPELEVEVGMDSARGLGMTFECDAVVVPRINAIDQDHFLM